MPKGTLAEWLAEREGEHFEFKEAKENYPFEKLVKYCAALANEGGGKIILGVTDKRPRSVVGTKAFAEPERTVAGLVERLRVKIECEEIQHEGGRVLVFHIPSRPIGMAIEADGAFWMRAGEALRAMTQDEVRRIVLEAGPDFSAEVCIAAGIRDLDLQAVQRFRGLWMEKSGNASLAHAKVEQVLEDAELSCDGRITYAALILFGTRTALAAVSRRLRPSLSTARRKHRSPTSSASNSDRAFLQRSMNCGALSICATKFNSIRMACS